MRSLPLAMVSAALAVSACSAEATDDVGEATAADTSAALEPRFFDPGVVDDAVFRHGNPDPATVDVATVEKIIADAETTGSDSVIVAVGDTIVAEKYFGHDGAPATVQSVTKSVTSLVIGALVAERKIPSVDAPLSRFYPEWSEGTKALVTVRHVVSMTSGVSDWQSDMFSHADTLAYARERPLLWEPGTTFAYTNAGSMLLAGVALQAGGAPLDVLARERFFGPLGITQWSWSKDGAGNVAAQGGLFMRPRDLLLLGRLMRDRGAWNGRQLLPSVWVDSVGVPNAVSPCYGLEWWVLRDGCDPSRAPAPDAVLGPLEGYFADGYGGQYITIVPRSNIVGVRTKKPLPTGTPLPELQKANYAEFPHQVGKLGR